MATPATYNLSLYQGDTFTLTFRLRQQNADGTMGAYLDLTGFSAQAEIRPTAGDPTVLAEFAATVLDQTTTPGGITLSLTHDQTAALLPTAGQAPYVWDVQTISPEATPTITTYLAGQVTVTAEVTR